METGAVASRFSPDSSKVLAIPDGDLRDAVRTKGLFGRGWTGKSRSWSGPISIPVWDASSGEVLFSITGLSLDIHDVVFSPDGRFIATADAGPVKLWDAENGSFVKALDKLTAARLLRFTPDSKFLLVKGGAEVGLWEVESGKQVHAFESPSIPFLKATLSDHGDHVIAWTSEGTV
jgi:WD40 repeat protein